MELYICKTCGTQFPPAERPPEHCPICEDERQYVGWNGQEWTTLDELRQERANEIREVEPGLTGIGTQPAFSIAQRALLVQTPEGNLLWDCISLIDADTIAAVKALGGITAIAISHPHYYSSMVEWSQAFNAPIYLHVRDQKWVMRPEPAVQFWEGEKKTLFGGLTLLRCGGHFAGGTVLHWPQGAAGRGALLTGDIINVVSDRRYVSFLYSYPNQIPLPASSVRHILSAVEPYAYDRIYSAWWDRVLVSGAKEGVRFSAGRYIDILEGQRDITS